MGKKTFLIPGDRIHGRVIYLEEMRPGGRPVPAGVGGVRERVPPGRADGGPGLGVCELDEPEADLPQGLAEQTQLHKVKRVNPLPD